MQLTRQIRQKFKAVIVLHRGANLDLEELQQFAREHLSAIEIPRILAIVDALHQPKSPRDYLAQLWIRAFLRTVGKSVDCPP